VEAIRFKNAKYWINPEKCVSCGHCAAVCHNEAISDPHAPQIAIQTHPPLTLSCDVLVIGAGASGLSAAAQAAEAGKQVLVLEKGKEIGGSAWYAHVFRSHWSKWHEAAGMTDPRDEVYREFMKQTEGHVNGKLVRRILDADTEFIDWLIEKHDLQKDFTFGPQPFGGYGITAAYDWEYNHKRIDTTIGPGGIGWWMTNKLLSIVEENGGKVLYHTSATELKVDEAGKLVGAAAKDAGGELHISCKACVVSTGAFTRNRALMAKFQPKFYADGDGDGVHVFTHPNCTGDGITMAEAIGADVDYVNRRVGMFGPMRHPFGTVSIAAGMAACFDVDREGNLCDLPMAPSEVSPLADVSGRYVWGIADEAAVEAAVQRSMGRAPDVPGICMDALYQNWRAELDTELAWETMYKADTLEKLAQKLHIAPEKLQTAADAYEKSLEVPAPELDGFPPMKKEPLGKGPYYAVYKKMFHENALGGVVIDENTNVLRGGRPVPGLYATGDGTRGIMVPGPVGVGYIEGTISALTFALTSGFIAGREAAKCVR
jgi:succinate dehydrogenase/fumarate reductase flavoprotein subunit